MLVYFTKYGLTRSQLEGKVQRSAISYETAL